MLRHDYILVLGPERAFIISLSKIDYLNFSFQRSQRATCSFIPFYKATWRQIKRQPSTNSPKTRPGDQILWRASLFASSECCGVRVRVEYQQNSPKKIALNKKRMYWKGLPASKQDIQFMYGGLQEQRINSEVYIKVLCETHERPTGR